MSPKKINPAALVALKAALTHVYWRKADLRGFLEACLGGSDLTSRLDWQLRKRDVVSNLVDYLSRQTSEQERLLTLMLETADMSDFSHLEREEDSAIKIADAERSVTALRKLVEGFSEVRAEQERTAERQRIAEAVAARTRATDVEVDRLLHDFMELTREPPQQRGYSLERLLRDLFGVFDLDPKASFKIVGEQIDGHFSFDGIEFLLEAKWQDKLVTLDDLDGFAGKIGRKLDNTLGLFWSYSGFAPSAVTQHSTHRPLMILAVGADLVAVLERRIALDDLLRRKKQHASRTGEILLTAAEILGS